MDLRVIKSLFLERLEEVGKPLDQSQIDELDSVLEEYPKFIKDNKKFNKRLNQKLDKDIKKEELEKCVGKLAYRLLDIIAFHYFHITERLRGLERIGIKNHHAFDLFESYMNSIKGELKPSLNASFCSPFYLMGRRPFPVTLNT